MVKTYVKDYFVTYAQAGSELYLKWVGFHTLYIYNQKLCLEAALLNMYSPTSHFPFFDLCIADMSLLIIQNLQKKFPSLHFFN